MSEEQDQTGGQRLRWWQAETTAAPPIGGVALRVNTTEEEVAATAPDIGLELEAEALRRSAAHSRGERVEIFANPHQNNDRLRKRLMIGIGAAAAYIMVISLLAHLPIMLTLALAVVLPAVESFLVYKWMSRITARETRPMVTLTTEGIVIYSLWQDLGLIRWDEIKEIRAYTQIYRYVGIVPKDVKALCARMTRSQSLVMRTNEFCRLWMYRPLRCFIAPINLAQQLMPITCDELIKKIEYFRRENCV